MRFRYIVLFQKTILYSKVLNSKQHVASLQTAAADILLTLMMNDVHVYLVHDELDSYYGYVNVIPSSSTFHPWIWTDAKNFVNYCYPSSSSSSPHRNYYDDTVHSSIHLPSHPNSCRYNT